MPNDPNLAAPRDATVREARERIEHIVELMRDEGGEWDHNRKQWKGFKTDLEAAWDAYDLLLAPREARGEPVAWIARAKDGSGYHYPARKTQDRALDGIVFVEDWEVVPLYAAPLPAERGREEVLEIAGDSALEGFAEWCELGNDNATAVKAYEYLTARRESRAALSPDAGGKP